MNLPTSTDVLVIGAGPAGCTAGTLIAQQGHRVTLVERDHFPRFRIGESLIPQTYWVLKRIGMLDKMKGSHFQKKYSVQFVTQHGKVSEPFFFADHRPHESSQTWQVRRSEFDHIMVQNAAEQGVDVHEGIRVLEVLFEGSQAVGARVRDEQGHESEIRAQVVVDASGQNSVLIDRLGLRDWDPFLKKAAIWTYWKGALRDPGEQNEGATLVLQTKDKAGWFWYIPLHDDIVSVGVVASYDYLFQNRASKDFEQIYFEEVDRCPGLQPRIKDAQRCDIFRAQKEYSYRAKQVGGDGWVMVGDAFGFLDPLYSSGVLLALVSGEMAADAINEGFANGDLSERQLRKWEDKYNAGMDRMRNLVCEFYNGFSFGRFVKKHPHLKGLITDVLIGDVFKEDIDILWPLMDEMRNEMAPAMAE